jgi:hypothetical protein
MTHGAAKAGEQHYLGHMTEPMREPMRTPLREGKVTGQQRDEIRVRYQDGEPADRIAAEFGLTVDNIRRIGGPRA